MEEEKEEEVEHFHLDHFLFDDLQIVNATMRLIHSHAWEMVKIQRVNLALK